MMLVRGLRQADERLARLDIASGITDALSLAAQDLDTKVVDVLSQPPGEEHSVPWLRTGELRGSIGHSVVGAIAIVGSSSDVAIDQELGTRTVPPRSFLAATAAATADEIVALIAVALARHLASR
jgi:hypothetical protein